jgi:hypothetical protein
MPGFQSQPDQAVLSFQNTGNQYPQIAGHNSSGYSQLNNTTHATFSQQSGYPNTNISVPMHRESPDQNIHEQHGSGQFDQHETTKAGADRQNNLTGLGRLVPGVGHVPPPAPKYSQPWILSLIEDEEQESNFLRTLHLLI